MDERQMAKSLGWFSIGLGLAELAAPKKVADTVGLDGHTRILQLFGLREIATGIGILMQPGNPNWLQARVAGDALDLALLGSALGEGNPKRGRATAAMAAVAGVTVLDIVGSEQLSQSAGKKTSGIHLRESVTIDHPVEDIYRFWRDIENLPRIMNHIESVREIGPGRTHWVAKAPAGMHVLGLRDRLGLLQPALDPGVAAGAAVAPVPGIKVLGTPAVMPAPVLLHEPHHLIHRRPPVRNLVQAFIDQTIRTGLFVPIDIPPKRPFTDAQQPGSLFLGQAPSLPTVIRFRKPHSHCLLQPFRPVHSSLLGFS
jgi:hypothetical protein